MSKLISPSRNTLSVPLQVFFLAFSHLSYLPSCSLTVPCCTPQGQCSLVPLWPTLSHSSGIILSSIIALDSNRRVSRFLIGICPNKTYSCIRRHRRNLMSMKETLGHCLYWSLIGIIEQVLIFVSSKSEMDSKCFFLIYNTFNFLHGFAHLLYHCNCIQLSYKETRPR